MSETNIWKDAPEGAEFGVVDIDDGRTTYYKVDGIDLVFYVKCLDDEFSSWEYSCWDGIQELKDNLPTNYNIYHKQ